MPLERSSDRSPATVTQSLRPSNHSPPPKRPRVRVAPESVPGLPAPEESSTCRPTRSSKPQAPTRPVAGGATVSVTGTSRGEPSAPPAVTRTVPVYVPRDRPAGLTDTDTEAGAVPPRRRRGEPRRVVRRREAQRAAAGVGHGQRLRRRGRRTLDRTERQAGRRHGQRRRDGEGRGRRLEGRCVGRGGGSDRDVMRPRLRRRSSRRSRTSPRRPSPATARLSGAATPR